MKLTKVSARNLKGLTFELDLAAISFLIGSNFAGKTARTDAIRLLLLGYLPELGKLPRSTFEICSGKDLKVSGEFDNGLRMRRRWYLKGDVVKTEEELPEIFNVLAAPIAVMLNAETYFALSDRQRVEYVFANIPNLGPEAEPPVIFSTVASDLGTTEELDREAVQRFFQTLAGEQLGHEEDVKGSWTAQSFIDFALGFSVEETKKAKAAAIVFEKTVQGLAHLRAAEVVEKDVGALDREREKLKAELQPLWNRRAELRAAGETARANKTRRQVLEVELREKTAFEEQLAARKRQIENLESARDAWPERTPQEIEEFRSSERELSNAVADHERQLREVSAGIERNTRELLEVQAKNRCPYCGAAGDGWKALKTGEIDSALAGLKTKLGQLTEHLGTLRNAATTAIKRLTDAKTHAGLRDGKQREIVSATQVVNDLERKLAAMSGKEAELARLPVDGPDATLDASNVATLIELKDREILAVETKRRAAAGREHDVKRLAEAEKGRDDARKDEAVAKAAADGFRKAQADLVEAAFGPLLRTANGFFPHVLKTPLAYREAEIGTWRDGVWVGHRTFSGTEKALTYAAIQAALASKCPVRIMLIDELGRLDAGNAANLVAGVREGIQTGTLDQFIGIDHGRAEAYQSDVKQEDLTVVPIS